MAHQIASYTGTLIQIIGNRIVQLNGLNDAELDVRAST